MTKVKDKLVAAGQLSLFDLLRQEQTRRATSAPGRLNVAVSLQTAVRQAIRQAPKSREMLADELSELTGTTVSVHMVNNWTAESHPHRFPAELLPAFCQVTGDIEPLRLLAEAAGVFTLPGPDALRAEIQKLDEEARQIGREKRKRELFLREMEK